MYKYFKISRSNFFTITILSLHSNVRKVKIYKMKMLMSAIFLLLLFLDNYGWLYYIYSGANHVDDIGIKIRSLSQKTLEICEIAAYVMTRKYLNVYVLYTVVL